MKHKLPPEIISRKKMGFPVPVGSWLRGQHRSIVDEYVLGPRAIERGLFEPAEVRSLVRRHCDGGENHSERLWALITLEIWQRTFIDGELPAELLPQPLGSTAAVA
jgi:asparagine synthase (glutamine-hydrolysing)